MFIISLSKSCVVLEHVSCVDPEVLLVLEGHTVHCHDTVVLSDGALESLAVQATEMLLKSVGLLSEISLELGCELWLSEDDDDIDTVRLILRVHELRVAHKLRFALLLLEG